MATKIFDSLTSMLGALLGLVILIVVITELLKQAQSLETFILVLLLGGAFMYKILKEYF